MSALVPVVFSGLFQYFSAKIRILNCIDVDALGGMVNAIISIIFCEK